MRIIARFYLSFRRHYGWASNVKSLDAWCHCIVWRLAPIYGVDRFIERARACNLTISKRMQGTRVCSIPSNHGGNSDQQVGKVGPVWEKILKNCATLLALRSIVSEKVGYKCDIWTCHGSPALITRSLNNATHFFPNVSHISLIAKEGEDL